MKTPKFFSPPNFIMNLEELLTASAGVNGTVFLAMLGVIALIVIKAVINQGGSIKIGELQATLAKPESTKEPDKSEAKLMEARAAVEENVRHVIARQFGIVNPFLQSLKPIFNRLMYSMLDDAIKEALGIERTIKSQVKRVPAENISEEERTILEDPDKFAVKGHLVSGSWYEEYSVKQYKNNHSTRVFTNLVESSVDSLISDLEAEIFKMLVNNNIGKSKDEVRDYIHSRSENIVGIIRNNLCESYNKLSNKSMFDTHPYWQQCGIEYPVDWIEDKIYTLFKNCLDIRYNDFKG